MEGGKRFAERVRSPDCVTRKTPCLMRGQHDDCQGGPGEAIGGPWGPTLRDFACETEGVREKNVISREGREL